MNTQMLSVGDRGRFAIVLVSMLLGWSVFTIAQNTPAKKPAAPTKPALTPAKPTTAAKPAGNPAADSVQQHTGPPTGNLKGPTPDGGSTQSPRANSQPKTHAINANARPWESANKPSTGSLGSSNVPHPPAGSKTLATKNGLVTRRADGRVSDLHDDKRGMDIHHGLDGSRRVSVARPDGSRLVVERGRPGYVERGYKYHDHDFAQRSYYYNGRHYDRYYHGFAYRGVHLNVYAPAYYYGPGFYGWAYNPWAVPVAYGWGWAGTPWYGFYSAYFTPWAVYPSAAFWLTDYLIAADLQAAYAAGAQAQSEPALINQREGQPGVEGNISTWIWNGQQYEMTFNGSHCGNLTVVRWDDDGIILSRTDFNGFRATYTGRLINAGIVGGDVTWFPPGQAPSGGTWSATFTPVAPQRPVASTGATPLTPEMKQLIADEVKNQLALENAEAVQTAQNQDVDAGSSGIARVIDDVAHGNPHIFVVGGRLDVTNESTERECQISDGDALQLQTSPLPDATVANLVVKASKGGVECAPGSTIAVNLADLQDMQNHMRESIDVGLKQLQAKQGSGGLPPAPPSAQSTPTQPKYAAIGPPAPPQDAADLQVQSKEADNAEAEAQGSPMAVLSHPL